MLARRCLRLFVGVAVMFVAFIVHAEGTVPQFQWPITKGELPDLGGITSTFGESRTDHFHNGVDIAGQNDPILPVAPGEIVYTRDSTDDPFYPEQGPGNYAFLYHRDGWWSGYYHLRAYRNEPRQGAVTSDTVIAHSGNTGHSGGAHLHFFIAAENGQKIINPLEVLPQTTDNRPPDIQYLVIIPDEDSVTRLSPDRVENIRLTHSYPLLLQIRDPGLEKNTRRGVYRLRWKLNDGAWNERQYSSIVLEDNEWRLAGEHTFEESFQYDLYHLTGLEFVDGFNELTVEAEDFARNKSTAVLQINVDREY